MYFHMFMGKIKVQEVMSNFAPLLMGSSSSIVVTIGPLRELVVTIATDTWENLWKTITNTSISLLVN